MAGGGATGGTAEEQVAGGPVREEGFEIVVWGFGHGVVVVEGIGDFGGGIEPVRTADADRVVPFAATGVDGAGELHIVGLERFSDDDGCEGGEEGVGFVGEVG